MIKTTKFTVFFLEEVIFTQNLPNVKATKGADNENTNRRTGRVYFIIIGLTNCKIKKNKKIKNELGGGDGAVGTSLVTMKPYSGEALSAAQAKLVLHKLHW